MTSRACTPPSCSWEQRSLPSNGASASARLSLSIPRSELSHISVEWLPLRIFLSNDFQRKSPGDKILFGMRRIQKSVGDLSENHFSVSFGLDFGSPSFLKSVVPNCLISPLNNGYHSESFCLTIFREKVRETKYCLECGE
jgi:hypothetical protein